MPMMTRLHALLFTFSARIGRRRFWLGIFCLLIATIALSAIAFAIGFGETATQEGYKVVNGTRTEISGVRFTTTPIASLVIALLLTAPWLAIAIKRRHDRGASGYDVMGFTALNLLDQVLTIMGITGGPVVVLDVVVLVWGVVLLILMGFLKGDSGSNAHGDDPLGTNRA